MTAKRTARRCIFCGAKADSKEHVFPDWINNVILGSDFDGLAFTIDRGAITEQRTHRVTKAAHLRTRIVCHKCNHGWMSSLEGHARELLTPLILGNETTLTQVEQLLAAAWAAKTAMVGEAIQHGGPVFPQEDREIVREQQRPPLRARVSIAAYNMDEPVATRYARGAGHVLLHGRPLMDFYVHIIQVLHLVFAVRGTHALPATDNRALETIAEPRHLEIPIFPPVERCVWPPGLVMDDATLMEYSGAHNVEITTE